MKLKAVSLGFTTYDTSEVARVVETWDGFTNFINTELENLEVYSGLYSVLIREHLSTAYESGQIDSVAIPNITNETDA